MHETRHDFLTGPAFPGDHDAGLGGGNLFRKGGDIFHDRVAVDEGLAVFGDSLQHGCNQLGVRGQGDIFLGATTDGRRCNLGVGTDTAGHHRDGEMLRPQFGDQRRDIQRDFDHEKVGPACPEGAKCRINIGGVRHLRAALDRYLAGCAQLPVQGAHNE